MTTIIELMGLPGSGKSTLSRELEPIVTSTGRQLSTARPLIYRGRSRLVRLLMQVAVHWRYRRIAAPLYLSAARTGMSGLSAARVIPSLLVDTERRAHAHAQSGRGDVILFDQGVLQQLRSILGHGVGRPNAGFDRWLPDVLRCLRAVPSSEVTWLVVVIDVPAEVASGRIRSRASNSGRFDRMGDELRLLEYSSESLAQELIVSTLTREGLATIIHLDGREPIAALTAQLLTELPAVLVEPQ